MYHRCYYCSNIIESINKTNKNLFSVNIISHTLKNTTLGLLKLKDNVNIEIDTIARYAVNAAECFIKEKENE